MASLDVEFQSYSYPCTVDPEGLSLAVQRVNRKFTNEAPKPAGYEKWSTIRSLVTPDQTPLFAGVLKATVKVI